MVPPSKHWCIQIDVTNACNLRCSNCTRSLAHAQNRFVMTAAFFEKCVVALKDFPKDSVPSEHSPHKLIGIFGGEPLLHPQFDMLAATLSKHIPKEHRGLWTGLEWRRTKWSGVIRDVFNENLIHNNRHNTPSCHSPVLVASSDVVPDEKIRRDLIDSCWLQAKWSSCVTPKGFYFCEVAAALDQVFGGPGGLPVEPDCWRRPLEDFQPQIDMWCNRCGVCLNLAGRWDYESVDDISESNIESLKETSPRIKEGKYVLFDPKSVDIDNTPWIYKR